MAKKKQKEEVVETTTQEQVSETKTSDDKIRIKKPTFTKTTDEVTKVDLREVNKPEEEVINKEEQSEENVVEQENTNELSSGEQDKPADSEDSVKQEDQEQDPKDEQDSVLEEITDEEVKEEVEDLKSEIEQAETLKESGVELPENIQKVVDFMNDTGGTLEDYVKINQDFDSLDSNQLLKEFYKSTKPHLTGEEIDFLMEDSFSYEEDIDDERDIKRKKLALKEQVANAKQHLDGLKSKYYDEIKAGSRLTQEQKKAVDFFNRYNKQSEEATKVSEKQKLTFNKKTSEVFSDDFKGFEYKVGDKRFRFNVKEADKVKQTQSDINNFVRKFLNKDNEMVDAKGYHKSLFTAMNSDAIANHFYEQGKADAIKQSIAKSKNIDMNPRQGHEGFVEAGGIKVRALTGDNSSDFKFKIKK
tara:strand:+ start:268 stop:1515 length:1248 start_codon:yes stop_codon:yes gene_type:complete